MVNTVICMSSPPPSALPDTNVNSHGLQFLVFGLFVACHRPPCFHAQQGTLGRSVARPVTVKQDPNTKGPRGETKQDIRARVAARVAEVQAQRAAAAAAAAQNGQAT